MLSGKLFHNGIILLEKLIYVYHNEYVTAAMQIYDFLCHLGLLSFYTFTRYPFSHKACCILDENNSL